MRQPRYGHGSITIGTQTIIFGGLRSLDVEERPSPTSEVWDFETEEFRTIAPMLSLDVEERPSATIETEVFNFETGESKTIVPILPQDLYSHGIALYFVHDAKFCVIEKTDETSTEAPAVIEASDQRQSVSTSTKSPADYV